MRTKHEDIVVGFSLGPVDEPFFLATLRWITYLWFESLNFISFVLNKSNTLTVNKF